MKLKLSQEGDIAVLDISEDVEAANVPVLRAGIVKFLHSGKNKIVLDVSKTKNFTREALKEVIALHLIAHELNGNIVIVGKTDLVQEATVQTFANVNEALRFFSNVVEPAMPAAPLHVTVTAPSSSAMDVLPEVTELRARADRLAMENKILLGKVQNKEKHDPQTLLKERDELKEQVAALEDQLRGLIVERKEPFNESGMRGQMAQLEEALTQQVAKNAKA